MNRYFLLVITAVAIISCKTGSYADQQYIAGVDKNVYKLVLNQDTGSAYGYEINIESDVKMERMLSQRNKQSIP